MDLQGSCPPLSLSLVASAAGVGFCMTGPMMAGAPARSEAANCAASRAQIACLQQGAGGASALRLCLLRGAELQFHPGAPLITVNSNIWALHLCPMCPLCTKCPGYTLLSLYR